MNSPYRLCCCAGAVCALALAAFWADRRLGADRDWGCWSAAEQALSEAQRSEELELQREAFLRSLEAQQQITLQVLDGRLNLLEAAAHFRVNLAWRDDLLSHLDSYPGNSTEERLCRCVIAYVAAERTHDPCRRTAVVASLEAELADHLARHGTVRLPPASRD